MDVINEVWPNWHTQEMIGEGSFGKVYKAVREDLGHYSYCAVKVISLPHDVSEVKELTSSGMDECSINTYYEDMVRQLMDEIKIMESLKTASNIVAIEDFQIVPKEDGIGWNVFIRMELLTSLNEYLVNHTMSVDEVVNLGMDICEALKACESVNIIHRDIKVENIFVNSFGKFKLGDFGIARQLEKTQSVLSKKGTGMYMAPEVYKGENYDHTVDIYSLGIVMYRFLNNGRYPFMPPVETQISFGDRENSLMRRIRGERLLAPANADKELTKILCKACEFNPKERYLSAEEFYCELRRYKESKNIVDEKEILKEESKRFTKNFEEYDNKEVDSQFGEKTVGVFSRKVQSMVEQEEYKNEDDIDEVNGREEEYPINDLVSPSNIQENMSEKFTIADSDMSEKNNNSEESTLSESEAWVIKRKPLRIVARVLLVLLVLLLPLIAIWAVHDNNKMNESNTSEYKPQKTIYFCTKVEDDNRNEECEYVEVTEDPKYKGKYKVWMTNEYIINTELKSVKTEETSKTEYIVKISFNEQGKKLFADFTSQNVGEVGYIICDGEVVSDPTIEEIIPTGQVEIVGIENLEQAEELAGKKLE